MHVFEAAAAMKSDEEVVALFINEAATLRAYLVGQLHATPQDADDCVQDAFLSLARFFDRIGRLEYPLAYVYKVARHGLFKIQKHAGRVFPTESSDDMVDISSADLADDLVRQQDEKDVRSALDSMRPNRAREAITLRFVSGFDLHNTAQIMGISTGAVKRYTSDGLAQIRALLKEDPSGEGRR